MGGPSIPDPNQAAVAGAQADLRNFPFTYMVNALAAKGGKGTLPNGQTYDFTGLGDAQNAAAVSDKTAQALLDIQQNYGPAYIKQRLDELKQSDPTGYAARQQLFDKIIADSQANPDRPLATDTQNQIMSLLQQGGKLTTGPGSETEQVQQGVRGQQIAKGNYLGNAAAEREAAAVEGAGEQQRNQRQQQAQSFQMSGVSPEDVQYRRIQQSLSNLGAFVSGTTPEAEFGSLSSAGNGAAPFTTGPGVNAQTNPNASLFGLQNAATGYQGAVNYAAHSVNPFLSGIQGVFGGLQTANNLGWNPFNTSPSAPAIGSTYAGYGGNTYTSAYSPTGGGWSVPSNTVPTPVSIETD